MSALVATVVPWLNRPISAQLGARLTDAGEHAIDRVSGRRNLDDVKLT